MAVEQEQNQAQTQQNQPGDQELQLGTGASAPSASTTQTNQPINNARRREPQGSGRFSNLQKYIGANQQYNEAGGGMAGKIQEQSSSRLDSIRQGIQNQKTQAQNQYNQLQQNLGQQGQQLQQQAFQDPNAILQNQQQLSEFQKLRTGGYGQDIQGLAQGVNQFQPGIQGLQQAAQQAGTEQGRFQLLRNRFAQPGYSTGQQRLDQLLLQATPGAARSLKTGLQGFAQEAGTLQSGLESDIQSRQSELQGLAGQRQSEIQNLLQYGTTEGLESELGQRGLTDIEQGLNQQLESLRQTAPEQYQQLLSRVQSGSVLESDLPTLGLQAGQNLYNLDLAQYLSPEDVMQGRLAQATAQQVASPDEIRRYQALQQLGQMDTGFFSGLTPEQGGQFSPYGFDVDQFNRDVGLREQSRQNIQQQINPKIQKYIDTLRMDPAGSLRSQLDQAQRNQGPEVYGWLMDAINNADLYKQDASQANADKLNAALNTLKDKYYGTYSNQTTGIYQPGYDAFTELYKSLLPDYLNLQSDRKLQINPQDIESGGQFNVT
jgi:hypothetical protein